MTYDQALAIVKTAMKNGQTVGVAWDEVEETFTVCMDDHQAPPMHTHLFEVAVAHVAMQPRRK